MKHFCLFYFFLCLGVPTQSAQENIIQCKNNLGKLIYTDQVHLCVSEIQSKTLSSQNVMASQHVKIDVNYGIHRRAYSRYENSDWIIFYESSMRKGDPNLLSHALVKLHEHLKQVESILPASAIARLKKVDFYLLWGRASPQGGKSSGLRYLRKNEREYKDNIDPTWSESVVIFSAKNFMYLKPKWTQHVLVHELAHAWHIQEKWLYNKEIRAAAKQAERKKLYHLLKDANGRYIPKAYAMKNFFEYFSEMSTLYFSVGHYFPFNREGLKQHDPQAFQLMQQAWPAH